MKNIQKMITLMLLAASLMVSGCASSSSEMTVDKGVPSPDSFTFEEQMELVSCLYYNRDYEPISEKEKFALIETAEGREKLGVNSPFRICLAKLTGAKIVTTFSSKELPDLMEYMEEDYIDRALNTFAKRRKSHHDDALWKQVAELYPVVFPD